MAGLSADVVIVGGSLAGSSAAILLARQGLRVILIDPASVQPPVFRAEKLEPDQIALLRKFGLMDALLPWTASIREIWEAGNGRVLHIRLLEQYGIFYHDMVNAVRAVLPAGVQTKVGRVRDVVTANDVQRVILAGGEEYTARLVVLAGGTGSDVHARLGMRKQMIQSDQSLSFGFNMVRADGSAFPFEGVTYFPEGYGDRIVYLTVFRIRDVMRANLFTCWSVGEAGTRSFVREPASNLARLLPRLSRVIGEFAVDGRVEVGRVDLFRMEGHLQPGVVLLADAYQSVCPTTGTGLSKVVTDVDVFCHDCAPRWFSTPGMGVDKIAQFYSCPRKVDVDEDSLFSAGWQRQIATNGEWLWRARRVKRRWMLQVGGAVNYFRFTRKLTA
jgi:2-polyprenyl-6-methoxyphenol hydroxylase-like FAD-dependent oxidoreductase